MPTGKLQKYGPVAQRQEASDLRSLQFGFESQGVYCKHHKDFSLCFEDICNFTSLKKKDTFGRLPELGIWTRLRTAGLWVRFPYLPCRL